MKLSLLYIHRIFGQLFPPLFIFYLTLLIVDGPKKDFISPLFILSHAIIPLLLLSLFYLTTRFKKSENPAVYSSSQWFVLITLNVFFTFLLLYRLEDRSFFDLIGIPIAVILTILVPHVLATWKSRKVSALTSFFLILLILLSILPLTTHETNFISFDFWNHFNSSKFFILTGYLKITPFSYSTFYALFAGILTFTNTSIETAVSGYFASVFFFLLIGTLIMILINSRLHPNNKLYAIIGALLFILIPSTPWGGPIYFIPNNISLLTWPLFFYFGVQIKKEKNLFLFLLCASIIFLYHPWDFVILVPSFVIWKLLVKKHYERWQIAAVMIGGLVLFVEMTLWIFSRELFLEGHTTLFPNFIGIYQSVKSEIATLSNFNPQVLFTLKSFPLIFLSILGSLLILIKTAPQLRSHALSPRENFLLSQVILLFVLFIFSTIFSYNFRLVSFALFVSAIVSTEFLIFLFLHNRFFGTLTLTLIVILLLQNNIYHIKKITSESIYLSQAELTGFSAGIEKIPSKVILLTDPHSGTFVSAVANNFYNHTDPNNENLYFDIFAKSEWSASQIEYLKKWDIQYLVITNRTVEWVRTGSPTTTTNSYIESLTEFKETKDRMRRKFEDKLKTIYDNDAVLIYLLPEEKNMADLLK